MNQYIRKFVAATAIVAVGSVAAPFSAFAVDSNTAYVDGAPVVTVPDVSTPENSQPAQPQTPSVLPLRSALNGVGVDVEWQQITGGQQIVLVYGGASLTVKIDAAGGVLTTAAGSYAYSNVNGSLQTGLDFFQSLFTNASVTANGTGGISVTAIDASQPVSLIVAENDTTGESEGNYTYYESGLATWYGSGAQGNYTASGEIFNMYDYTAAHKYLPFGTVCRVTDTDTGKSVVVRINDRGPFGAGRVIDLSYQAANDIGMISKGVANVTVEVLSK